MPELPNDIYALICTYYVDLVLTDLFETLLWRFRYHKNIIHLNCLFSCVNEAHDWDLRFVFTVLRYLKEKSI